MHIGLQESSEYSEIRQLVGRKFEEWYGPSLDEFAHRGQEVDAYTATVSGQRVAVCVVWSSNSIDFFHDLLLVSNLNVDVKIVIVNPNILTQNDLVKVFDKVQTAHAERKVWLSDMIDGTRLLRDPEYVNTQFKQAVEELIDRDRHALAWNIAHIDILRQVTEQGRGVPLGWVQQIRSIAQSAYESESILSQLMQTRNYDPKLDGRLEFHPIFASHTVSKTWTTDSSIDPSSYFSEVGREIALDERRYLSSRLRESIQRKTLDGPLSFDELRNIAHSMKESGDPPKALLASLNLLTSIYGWHTNIEFTQDPETRRRCENLIIDANTRLRIFWHRTGSPKAECFLLAPTVGTWIVNPDPDTGHPLTVRVGEISLYRNHVRVIVGTRASFFVRNPNAAQWLRFKS